MRPGFSVTRASDDPGSIWLFVTVETCSISIRLDSDQPSAVVAMALFGDGAAAAVVTSGEHSLARIRGSAENTPERRSNKAFLPPNASRARAFTSACSTMNGGTDVASESKLQGRVRMSRWCVIEGDRFT